MIKQMLLGSIISWTVFAYAGDLDLASIEALAKTKELLVSATKRAEKIKGDEGAQRADTIVDKLGVNPDQKQDIYKLAASIFEKMIKDNNGDATAVNKLLRQSPEAFASLLGPKQLDQIKELAKEIEKGQGLTPSP